jgi:hypothetical protein
MKKSTVFGCYKWFEEGPKMHRVTEDESCQNAKHRCKFGCSENQMKGRAEGELLPHGTNSKKTHKTVINPMICHQLNETD